jgi:alginate O-acetyltransferase complex protein AlgI
MNVCSAGFLFFCCLGPVLFHAMHGRRMRQFTLTFFNIQFLFYLIPNLENGLCLAAFVVGSYGILKCLNRRSSSFFVFFFIGTFIAVFVYLKHYSFLTWLLPSYLLREPVELIGISYILFKVIHVMVDRWQGVLSPCTFLSYLNYQLNIFTIIAGPIQRYNDFYQFWEEMGLSSEGTKILIESWIRIFSGMIKIGAVSSLSWSFFAQGVQSLQQEHVFGILRQFCCVFYGYPIYLYFNFSGYIDVVIGAARLFGYRLPENFNRPYLARNIVDFWNRWHMTLTHWIRDYVFMTSYKAVAEHLPRPSKLAGYLIAFASLLIAGLWHGAASGFALFGAIHGLGVAANQAGADVLKTIMGVSGYTRYLHNKLIHAAAVLVTFHYVCFSFLFFSLGSAGALQLLMAVAHECAQTEWTNRFYVLGCGLLLVYTVLALFFLRETAFFRVKTWAKAGAGQITPLYLVLISEAVLVTMLLFSLWAFGQSDPVVVYMKF